MSRKGSTATEESKGFAPESRRVGGIPVSTVVDATVSVADEASRLSAAQAAFPSEGRRPGVLSSICDTRASRAAGTRVKSLSRGAGRWSTAPRSSWGVCPSNGARPAMQRKSTAPSP